MKNVSMRLDGNYLIMKIDLTKTLGQSRTGKTLTVASTQGNIDVPGYPDSGIKIGVNVFKYQNTPKFNPRKKSVSKKRTRIKV